MFLTNPCYAVTTQVHLAGSSSTAINTASTIFVYLSGSGGGSTTEANRQHPAGSAGTIVYMKACLTTDPANGVGIQSVSFTTRIATADSSTTCTISEGDSDLCCETSTTSAYTTTQFVYI